jgi:hypothetical protein
MILIVIIIFALLAYLKAAMHMALLMSIIIISLSLIILFILYIRHRKGHVTTSFLRKVGAIFAVFISITTITMVINLNNAEYSTRISQTDGVWVASDNSLRIHFIYPPSNPGLLDIDEILSPTLRSEIILTDLLTGNALYATIFEYNISLNDHKLIFSINPSIDTNERPHNNKLLSEFAVTEFSENSLTIQMQNQQPLRFSRVDRPNSLEDVVRFSKVYSTEEYLIFILLNFKEEMTFYKFLNEEYTIYFSDLTMDEEASNWLSLNNSRPLSPGKESMRIMDTLSGLLSPISDRIEKIICTEKCKYLSEGEAHWIARFTLTSDKYIYDVLEDTATGYAVHEVIK